MFSTFIKKVATAIVATTIVSAFSISAYADDENVSSDVTNVISEDVENETPEMEPTIISMILAMLSPKLITNMLSKQTMALSLLRKKKRTRRRQRHQLHLYLMR